MIRLAILASLAALAAFTPAPAQAHTYTCWDVDVACVRGCTTDHLRTVGPHHCAIASSGGSSEDHPTVEIRECRSPTFGWAVYVNGNEVAPCMI